MRLADCLLVALATAVGGTLAAPVHAADDGRRAVEVKRYGISVRVPQAWRLITWGRDAEAFALKLPQDTGSTAGLVWCELGVAPENLDDYRQRIAAEEVSPPAAPGLGARRLVENRLEAVDPRQFGEELARRLGQRLVSVWEFDNDKGVHIFEVRVRIVHDGTLYTFGLTTDEAHYDAYRLDFEEMLASSKLSPPETGLQRLPQGYWMQRDFRFAIRLPEGWKPSFGPNDNVLFFATGRTHQVFTDNLLVLASPPRPLDLAHLRDVLPEDIKKQDEHAVVEANIVRQGPLEALETVVRTRRGSLEVTILQRRFRTPLRNYDVKFTCESGEFEKLQEQLRRALDSFVELQEDARQSEA